METHVAGIAVAVGTGGAVAAGVVAGAAMMSAATIAVARPALMQGSGMTLFRSGIALAVAVMARVTPQSVKTLFMLMGLWHSKVWKSMV